MIKQAKNATRLVVFAASVVFVVFVVFVVVVVVYAEWPNAAKTFMATQKFKTRKTVGKARAKTFFCNCHLSRY